MKTNPVVHFEMPYENRKRMAEFYTKVFGWKTQMLGPEMGEYVVVTTTESDKKTGRPIEPGAINGGFFEKNPDRPDQLPSVVISVDNIKGFLDARPCLQYRRFLAARPGAVRWHHNFLNRLVDRARPDVCR